MEMNFGFSGIFDIRSVNPSTAYKNENSKDNLGQVLSTGEFSLPVLRGLAPVTHVTGTWQMCLSARLKITCLIEVSKFKRLFVKIFSFKSNRNIFFFFNKIKINPIKTKAQNYMNLF